MTTYPPNLSFGESYPQHIMIDTNCVMLSGEVAYRQPLKIWTNPAGEDIVFCNVQIESERLNGKGELTRDRHNLVIWGITPAVHKLIVVGTRILVMGQLKTDYRGRTEVTVHYNTATLQILNFSPQSAYPIDSLPALVKGPLQQVNHLSDSEIKAIAEQAGPIPPVDKSYAEQVEL